MAYYGRRRRAYSNGDYFDNYREIGAKFDSKCGNASCNASITTGDCIGYNPGLRKVVCKDCWQKWKAENREARAYEETGSDCSYDY